MTIASSLNNVIFYTKVINDSLVQKAAKLLQTDDSYGYFDIYGELIAFGEDKGIKGDLWKAYITHLVLKDENSFSLQCERYGENVGQSLREIALNDFKAIKKLYNLNLIFPGLHARLIRDYVPTNINHSINIRYGSISHIFSDENLTEEGLNSLITYYHTAGCGMMGQYTAFRWDGEELLGIEDIANITFKDLVGIENQKKVLIENTNILLKGRSAGNVLLYGDSGTGKSSCIKALINEYGQRGLRLIEVSKHQMKDIPDIYEILRKRGLKFVIFMDDLSFEENETDYKYLKAILEGGLQVKPHNVVIYATSNRRHLINERWNERGNIQDIHVRDSIQERTSLSDRFAITIVFQSPGQKEFLNIVKSMAKKHDIELSEEELSRQALQWEMLHNGRSGRTAGQFIDYLLGKMDK